MSYLRLVGIGILELLGCLALVQQLQLTTVAGYQQRYFLKVKVCYAYTYEEYTQKKIMS